MPFVITPILFSLGDPASGESGPADNGPRDSQERQPDPDSGDHTPPAGIPDH